MVGVNEVLVMRCIKSRVELHLWQLLVHVATTIRLLLTTKTLNKTTTFKLNMAHVFSDKAKRLHMSVLEMSTACSFGSNLKTSQNMLYKSLLFFCSSIAAATYDVLEDEKALDATHKGIP